MPQEALATKLKRHPTLTIFLMMLSGFCLLVMTGLFAPKALALLEAIDNHGISGMHWPHFLILIAAGLYGMIGFFFYLTFKVLEKAVVDDILTSLPKQQKREM